MKHITTLQATEYKGQKVYIRQIGNIFEYLVVMRGEVYTTHVVVTKLFWKDYTTEQLENATKFLMNMAQATIDCVLKK